MIIDKIDFSTLEDVTGVQTSECSSSTQSLDENASLKMRMFSGVRYFTKGHAFSLTRIIDGHSFVQINKRGNVFVFREGNYFSAKSQMDYEKDESVKSFRIIVDDGSLPKILNEASTALNGAKSLSQIDVQVESTIMEALQRIQNAQQKIRIIENRNEAETDKIRKEKDHANEKRKKILKDSECKMQIKMAESQVKLAEDECKKQFKGAENRSKLIQDDFDKQIEMIEAQIELIEKDSRRQNQEGGKKLQSEKKRLEEIKFQLRKAKQKTRDKCRRDKNAAKGQLKNVKNEAKRVKKGLKQQYEAIEMETNEQFKIVKQEFKERKEIIEQKSKVEIFAALKEIQEAYFQIKQIVCPCAEANSSSSSNFAIDRQEIKSKGHAYFFEASEKLLPSRQIYSQCERLRFRFGKIIISPTIHPSVVSGWKIHNLNLTFYPIKNIIILNQLDAGAFEIVEKFFEDLQNFKMPLLGFQKMIFPDGSVPILESHFREEKQVRGIFYNDCNFENNGLLQITFNDFPSIEYMEFDNCNLSDEEMAHARKIHELKFGKK